MVPLPSGVWMLAVGYRRIDPGGEPEIPRSFRGSRGKLNLLVLQFAIADSQYDQIDPNRTISAGKVEIGAFRTYPEASSSFFHI